MPSSLLNTFAQSLNGLWLIALGFKFGDKFETTHTSILQQREAKLEGGYSLEWRIWKFQITNPKQIPITEIQNSKHSFGPFGIGAWDLFGIWCLEIGAYVLSVEGSGFNFSGHQRSRQ
jgi:hypothetical protein